MKIQLCPDIPPLDTPAFDDWLREWHMQHPDLHVEVRPSIQSIADKHKGDPPDAPAPKFAKVKQEKAVPMSAKQEKVRFYPGPKPKPVKVVKPVYKKPPKPTITRQTMPVSPICPTCKIRNGSSLTAGYCLPCWQMHLSKSRGTKQASIDTLPEPIRTFAPALDAAIAREFGGEA